MATSSFDEKVVVTDPQMVAMMKRDIEGEDYQEEEDMTDEEVKKGLECCLDRTKGCKICPYIEDEDCLYSVRKDTLALINRLEEEKEQIRKETAKEILVSIKEHIFNVTAENDNFINLLKKEYGVEIEE